MKKALVLACALLLTAAGSLQAQKFGYCNSIALLRDMPEVKQADSDLQAFQTQLTKRGQQMVEELQAKAVELERKKEQGTISPKDYDMQMAVLQAEQEGIAKYEQEVYDQLAKKRQDLYEPILAKVDKAMKEVATEKGLMLVFDASTQVLLYADESLDVTNLVKAKLGIPITPATPPAGGQ